MANEKFIPVEEVEEGFVPVEEVGSMSWTEVAGEALKHTPQSAIEYFADIYQTIRHPVNTAKSMGNLAMGAIEKAVPGMKHLTPGPTYTLGTEEDPRAEAVNAVIDYYTDRYGSLDGFKKALAKDPVGVLGDFATLATAAGGAAGSVAAIKSTKVGGKLARAGAMMEPLNVATLPLRAAKRFIPDRAASKLYRGAIKFSDKLTLEERNRLATLGMDKKIMPTMNGLYKLQDELEALNNKIDGMVDAANSKGYIATEYLFKDIEKIKKSAMTTMKYGPPKSAIKAMDKVVEEIRWANGKLKRNVLTAREAQDLKKGIYKNLARYYSSINDAPAPVKVQKAVAGAAKRGLEVLIPEIKQLNRMDGDLLMLRDQIDRAAKRIGKRDLLAMGTTVRAGFGGAIAGKVGLGVGLALGLIDSQPLIKARVAIMVHSFKKKGIKVNLTPAVLRLITSEAGEIHEELSKE